MASSMDLLRPTRPEAVTLTLPIVSDEKSHQTAQWARIEALLASLRYEIAREEAGYPSYSKMKAAEVSAVEGTESL